MNIPKKVRENPEIPQASLSDISFVLLAFFLSTTTFDIKKGVGLVLPPPSDDSQPTKKVKLKDENLTKIKINRAGKIQLNEDIVPLNEMKKLIEEIVAENPKMVFSLTVDRKTDYNNMVKVLDRMRLAGAEKISLRTN